MPRPLRALLLMALTACCIGGPGAPGSRAASPPRTVEALLGMTFRRIPGGETGGAVLDTGAEDSWRGQAVGMPTVYFDGKTYRMWFAGGARVRSGESPYIPRESIGLATSPDGIRWTLANEGRPVLGPGAPGKFDRHSVGHPFVLRVGRAYMMWYGGCDGSQARNQVRIERIGLAISQDGINWTRANDGNPVVDVGPAGSIDSIQATGCHVLHRPDGFVMWYGAYGGLHSLARATSPDGIRWTRADGGKPVTGLAGREQLGPSVYFDGGRYLLFYSSNLDGQWVMLAATSTDGVRWEPALGGKPVLGPPPPDSFGTAGRGSNHSVHPSQFLIQGGRVRVWYSAEASAPPNLQRIGLMEAAQ
jgi:hypothetical protein